MARMRFTGERILPDLPGLQVTYWQSLAAYRFAADYAVGRHVLDCGSGEGYGCAELALRAAEVIGLDRDPTAASWAAAKYRDVRNLRLIAGDAVALPLADGSVSLVTCFQVLEHLPQPDRFLNEVRRVLADDGVLVLSTPNRFAVSTGLNPHHYHEYSAGELHSLLEPVFMRTDVLGVFGSERVLAYRSRNGRSIRALLRLDPLGLRRLIPAPVLSPIHAVGTRALRAWLHWRHPRLVQGITVEDFRVDHGDLDQSIDLLAVCSVRR